MIHILYLCIEPFMLTLEHVYRAGRADFVEGACFLSAALAAFALSLFVQLDFLSIAARGCSNTRAVDVQF